MRTASTERAREAMSCEVRIDRLLGRQVRGRNNQRVGRLEEFRVEKHRNELTIEAYVIGPAGLFERLGLGVKALFGGPGSGYIARWDQLDISDPEHPCLTCAIDELQFL